ncbi:MAG: hypothetical protein FJ091_05870 [Deltaproteobacteria bacterium]|nr:hypothetical protein [Deltaproteobacteria bacterium]
MTNPIGPILPADESFTHQVAETFAHVGTSDPAWTEKVCAMAMARDGSLQLGFGLGKYTNRNVMDAYAALSRGKEQLTVRASRELAADPSRTFAGPIHYEVVEPLRKIRFRLEANSCQPLAFDWLFEAALNPAVEERTFMRHDFRASAELVRYHQIGTCAGWIELDGRRIEMSPNSWVSTRDHSWGVRYDVGTPPTDTKPRPAIPPGFGFQMIWCPSLLTRADGSRYGLFLHYTLIEGAGFTQKHVTAKVEHADGREEALVDLTPELRFDPRNRRLLGGRVLARTADGRERPITLEVLSDTGVQLGAGLYFGFDGHHHGEWRGPSHLDGERILDCSEPATARRLHQIRDTAVRVIDPVGGGEGVGNCQPICSGPWPKLGLGDDAWM